jgi:hypothetical protein
MRNDWMRNNLLVTHTGANAQKSSMVMNTCVTTMSERGSNAWQYPRCGTILILYDLYAIPKALSVASNDGVNNIFSWNRNIKVHHITVWWPWWPRYRSLETTTDPACLIIPVQRNWNVLEYHCTKSTFVFMRAAKYPLTTEKPSKIHGLLIFSCFRPTHLQLRPLCCLTLCNLRC